ncbi:MAG: Gfo/Idh/MocA family oxidoreductase [Akkermansiaceae bacterium]|nr:Gfo/Idh/MocA family oxidoreductase [Akkermansiaceae bacterium]
MRLALLGCGSRGRTYARIIAKLPQRYQLVAAADHDDAKTSTVASFHEEGSVKLFKSDEELFAEGKIADVLIIATQDAQHYGHAMQALELGYDLLLEKPAAETLQRCEELHAKAVEMGRRIAPCFVLRYTPFYRAVREFIDSGRLGRVMSIRASEGVDAFHQAHSYVRGHWANTAKASPMIVAKCSHDTDLMCWFADSAPKRITSHGRLDWFKSENAPAGAPKRCTDGCPVAADCIYDAHRYITETRNYLRMVMPGAEASSMKGDGVTDEQILEFIKTSPWGRCVYHCDNDVVDHQVVACEMENGITATLTMTAFDCNRTIEIHGTRGSLRGGEPYQEGGAAELWFRDHRDGKIEEVPVEQASEDGYASHGGGDFGIIDALDKQFAGPNALEPGLMGIEGHRLAYLAEESRLAGGEPR